MKFLLWALALTASAQATQPSPSERREIEEMVGKYVLSYDGGDFSALKEVVAEDYWPTVGGEKECERVMRAKKKLAGRKAGQLRLLRKRGALFVQFDLLSPTGKVEERMEFGRWFRLRHESTGWRLGALVSDLEQ